MANERPLYVGCYVKFKENGENANNLFSPLEIDCTEYSQPTPITPNESGNEGNGGGM